LDGAGAAGEVLALVGAGLGFAAGAVVATVGLSLGFAGAVLYLIAGLATCEAAMLGFVVVLAVENVGAAFVVASEAEVDVAVVAGCAVESAAGAALVAALVAVAVDGFALAAAAVADVGDGFFGTVELSRAVFFGGVAAPLVAAMVEANFGGAGTALTAAVTLVGRVALVVTAAGFTPVDADRVAVVLVFLEAGAVAVVVVEAYALAAQHLGSIPHCRGSAALRATGSKALDARDAFIVVMSR
jgi:hypothetical protein